MTLARCEGKPKSAAAGGKLMCVVGSGGEDRWLKPRDAGGVQVAKGT